MKEEPASQRYIYVFGKFVLDPHEKILLADGQSIHLPAKEFETLRMLVENNGRALSKDEMLTEIWPGTFVEENNLAKIHFSAPEDIQWRGRNTHRNAAETWISILCWSESNRSACSGNYS